MRECFGMDKPTRLTIFDDAHLAGPQGREGRSCGEISTEHGQGWLVPHDCYAGASQRDLFGREDVYKRQAEIPSPPGSVAHPSPWWLVVKPQQMERKSLLGETNC